MADQF